MRRRSCRERPSSGCGWRKRPLTIDLTAFASISFIVAPDGSLTTNVPATLSNFDIYQIASGAGADTITTRSGNDIVEANGGNDTINTADGNDTLDGGAGADAMTGGAGDDIYVVDDAGDTVTENAGEGADEIRTTLANASLAALANIENLTGISAAGQTLTGNGANNVINGGSGNDIIDGGTGADMMSGGSGGDLYHVDDIGDTVVEFALEGVDEVRTTLASFTLDFFSLVEIVRGTVDTGQTLVGSMFGNEIVGGAGNDILNGGGGADTMRAGQGNDLYHVDDSGDTVTENAGEGTDEVSTFLSSYTLGDHLENLTGTAFGSQTLRRQCPGQRHQRRRRRRPAGRRDRRGHHGRRRRTRPLYG